MRVLTLSTLFPSTVRPTQGAFVARQVMGLAALPGIDVTMIAPRGLPPWPLSLHPRYRAVAQLADTEIWQGLTVHRPAFRSWGPWRQAEAPQAMARAILPLVQRLHAEAPFDVIDAQYFWPDGPAAMQLSRVLGIPFSILARGSDIHMWGEKPEIGGQIVAAGQAAGGLRAVSAALKDAMVALGMPRDRIELQYTGVDKDRFKPVDRAGERRALGLNAPVLISAGSLVPLKRHDRIIAALRLIPDATLVIAGDGPERARLEAQAAAEGVAVRVRFLGAVAHEGLARYLATADVLIHASEREGLANVWVEALACGTPIVITDVGGAREVLPEDGPAGRVAGPEPEAIAAAVQAVLADPQPQAVVREAAARFSWDANAATLAAHLRRVAGL